MGHSTAEGGPTGRLSEEEQRALYRDYQALCLEADDLDAAIEIASLVPATRQRTLDRAAAWTEPMPEQ
jgi:hypothetical protein